MNLEELMKENDLEKLPEGVSAIALCIVTDDDEERVVMRGDVFPLSAGALAIMINVAHGKSGDLDEQKEHVDLICETAKEYLEEMFEVNTKKGEANEV